MGKASLASYNRRLKAEESKSYNWSGVVTSDTGNYEVISSGKTIAKDGVYSGTPNTQTTYTDATTGEVIAVVKPTEISITPRGETIQPATYGSGTPTTPSNSAPSGATISQDIYTGEPPKIETKTLWGGIKGTFGAITNPGVIGQTGRLSSYPTAILETFKSYPGKPLAYSEGGFNSAPEWRGTQFGN